jgi:hypothetical protein
MFYATDFYILIGEEDLLGYSAPHNAPFNLPNDIPRMPLAYAAYVLLLFA